MLTGQTGGPFNRMFDTKPDLLDWQNSGIEPPLKTPQGEADRIESLERIVRFARNVLRLTLVTGLLGLLFLGAAFALSGCNNFQPLCQSECFAGTSRPAGLLGSN